MPQNAQNDFANPNNYIYSNLSLFYFNIWKEVELRLNLTPKNIVPPSVLTGLTNAYDVVAD
jgi:hypothetical protein